MKSRRRIVAVACVTGLCAVAVVGAFAIGVSVGQRQMMPTLSHVLNNTQTKLTFDRIEEEHKLYNYLRKGCYAPASSFLEFRIDVDMQLIHDAVAGEKNIDTALSYIKDRNPSILKEAATYSTKFPDGWIEPACK